MHLPWAAHWWTPKALIPALTMPELQTARSVKLLTPMRGWRQRFQLGSSLSSHLTRAINYIPQLTLSELAPFSPSSSLQYLSLEERIWFTVLRNLAQSVIAWIPLETESLAVRFLQIPLSAAQSHRHTGYHGSAASRLSHLAINPNRQN